MPLKFHTAGWNEVVREVVDNTAVPMARSVADAANATARQRNQEFSDTSTAAAGHDNYMVSVEGEERLGRADYHATVITATAYAMRDNAKHNTLVANLYRAAR